MKITIGRIEVENYDLALDICKGLEASGKYECVLHPGQVLNAIRRENNNHHEIVIQIIEPTDKTPIGFADKEEK